MMKQSNHQDHYTAALDMFSGIHRSAVAPILNTKEKTTKALMDNIIALSVHNTISAMFSTIKNNPQVDAELLMECLQDVAHNISVSACQDLGATVVMEESHNV